MNNLELKTRINEKEVERNGCLVTSELKIAMQFTKLQELADKSTSKITNGCYSESLEGEINEVKNDLPNCKQLRDKTLLVDKTNSKKSPRLQTFVFSLILLQLVQVLGSGYGKSSLTSIEKRYQLNSLKIGVLQSCFHISNLCFVLIVGYVGSKWHRPRIIAIGGLLMSIASFVSTIPQFVNERYNPYSIQTSSQLTVNNKLFSNFLCNNTINETLEIIPNENSISYDSKYTTEESMLFAVFLIGSIIKGIGHTPIHPLGISYIDDFASEDNSAMYIGLFTAIPLLGPAVGFLLGSFTTKIWVDIGWVDVDELSVTPEDHKWVGAWWIGYLVSGVLIFLFTIPFFFFPRKLEKEGIDEKNNFCLKKLRRILMPLNYSINNEKRERLFSEVSDNEDGEISTKLIDEASLFSNRSEIFFQNSRKSFHEVITDAKYEQKQEFETRRSCLLHSSTLQDEAEFEKDFFIIKSSSTPIIAQSSNESSLKAAKDFKNISLKSSINSKDQTDQSISMKEKLSLKAFQKALEDLFRNKVFICIAFGLVFLTSFLAASVTYISKYMETQFDLSTSTANLLNGSVNLPIVVVGNLIGGLLIHRKHFTEKRALTIILTGLILTLLMSIILFFLAGNEVIIEDLPKDNFQKPCFKRCKCHKTVAICDSVSNITYSSSCYLGCSSSNKANGSHVFHDCKCLQASFHINSNHSNFNSLKIGRCPPQKRSSRLIIFVICMAVAGLGSGLATTPTTLTILRIVDPSQKSFAIGVIFGLTRALAWIPSPIYVGYAIEQSCLLWNLDDKAVTIDGLHCEVYDQGGLRKAFFGCTLLQLVLSVALYSAAFILVVRKANIKSGIINL